MTTEEEPVDVTGQEDNSSVIMEGYLDKRGKMKLVSTWKRYWFVLKGQLLLYYKSQMECHNLSVCRGSLNMGLASCVRPGAHRGPPANAAQGYTIEVVTRTQVITLRTKDRSLQEQWLKALLESMALPISSPMRNSGGPMHFRYSLDNLPIIEEANVETKSKEKQSTLPTRTSVSRRDSVLDRIKRIGGSSYSGSLETVLKRRSNKQSQQRSPRQPKIPQIKAVDRMLGMQNSDEESEKCGSTERNEDLVLKSDSPTETEKGKNVCLDESRNTLLDVSCFDGDTTNTTTEYSVNISGNSALNVSSTSESHEANGNSVKSSEPLSGGKQKSEKSKSETYGSSYSENSSQNEKCTITTENKEEVEIENKLYEMARENEDNINKTVEENLDGEDNKNIIENKLYEKSRTNTEEEYESEEEMNHFPGNSSAKENGKLYEEVHTEKQNENKKYIEEEEDEEYYSQYDKFSLLQSLSDADKEPDLPPRPSVSSKSSSELIKNEKQGYNKENDETENSVLYETSLNTTTSPSHLTSGGEGSPSVKKKSKLQSKIKLRKKKSPSKESVASEDGQNNSSNKKKRKMSFLRRMLNHYRKKPESQENNDEPVSSDDPEYETVDYTAAMLINKLEDNDELLSSSPIIRKDQSPGRENSSSPEKEVSFHKEKLFGTSLLTDQAMQELKMKLKVRDDTNASIMAPGAYVSEDNEGYETISPDCLLEKKPVPTPRPSKQNIFSSNEESGVSSEFRCNGGIDRPNKPPKLPPRRVGRPRSPWHDVPTNNSPIYGNFDDLAVLAKKKSEESIPIDSLEKTSEQTGEWDQEIQDELLGTPRGFVFIQNKWKAVEKSGELSRKGRSALQKSSSKDRSLERSGEFKVRHMRSSSGGSGKYSSRSDCSDSENRSITSSSSEIYTDVQKLSAKTIIKNINSQNIKNINKINDVDRSEEECTLSYVKNNETCDGDKVISNENFKHSSACETTKAENLKSERDKISGNYIQNNNSFTTEEAVTLRRPYISMSSNNNSEICHNETRILSPCSSHKHSKDNVRGDSSVLPIQKAFSNGSLNQGTVSNTNSKQMNGNCLGNEGDEEYDIIPRLNRHSDELNLLLAQLAEITSAPLLPQAATSLVDLPDSRKSKPQPQKPAHYSQPQVDQFVLGPINRRRHSDPDYDVPRPHGSLLQLLASNRMSSRPNQMGQEDVVIEATHFFNEADLISNSGRSSLSLRHSVISEVDDQSESSYYVSMAPDSLEVPHVRDIEGGL